MRKVRIRYYPNVAAYRIKIDKYREPRVLGASSVVIRRDPDQTKASCDEDGYHLRHSPVVVDHVFLEQPNRQHQRGVSGNRVNTSLEVGQLDHIVLQLDVSIVGEVGEATDADDENDQIVGGQVLERLPDLQKEMFHSVLGDVCRIELFEPQDRNGEYQDHREQQTIVAVDGESPGPAVLEIDLAVRVVGGGAVEKEGLDDSRHHTKGEAHSLSRREDLSPLLVALQPAQLHTVAVRRHVTEHREGLREQQSQKPAGD